MNHVLLLCVQSRWMSIVPRNKAESTYWRFFASSSSLGVATSLDTLCSVLRLVMAEWDPLAVSRNSSTQVLLALSLWVAQFIFVWNDWGLSCTLCFINAFFPKDLDSTNVCLIGRGKIVLIMSQFISFNPDCISEVVL